MIQKFFLASVAATMMTACSVEEGFDTPVAANEITFSVESGSTSRQIATYSANSTDRFIISARHNGMAFIDEEPVSLSHGGWINRNTSHVWPSEGNVDFFAYIYDETANNEHAPLLDIEQSRAKLRSFSVATDASRQTTLKYASAPERCAAGGSVPLQFKEALSEIVFCAKNSSSKLHVEISEVEVCNVHMQGDFIFPAGKKAASWDVSASSPKTSKAAFEVKTVGKEMDCLGEETTMHLIPQSSDCATSENGYSDGFSIVFRCAVWQLSDPAKGVQESDNMLIGDKNADGSVTFGELRIPLEINWHSGCRYVYSVNFGAGGISGIPVTGGTMLPVAFAAQCESIN